MTTVRRAPSLRVRLTISLLVLLVGTLGAFDLLVQMITTRTLQRTFDQRLESEARGLAGMVEEKLTRRWSFEYGGIIDFEEENRPAYFQLWMASGDTMARSRSLGGRQIPRRSLGTSEPIFWDGPLPDGRPGRFIQASIGVRGESSKRFPDRPRPLVTVVVARETEELTKTLLSTRLSLLAVALSALAIAAVAAIATVARGLRPLSALAAQIAKVDSRKLETRVELPHLARELEVPVRTLNDLLDRLAASFARERRFTADVSHELRTPLSGIRAAVDVALAKARSEEEYRQVLREIKKVTREMTSMSENLLMLARLDSHQVEVSLDIIDWRSFVLECWEQHAAPAAERKLVFENRMPAIMVMGDQEKLRLILNNLFSNAVAYTERGGTVVVGVPEEGVLIDVEDSGPPIADGAMPRLFEPFFRAERARSNTEAHHGIGLAIVASLAELLGLRVTATNVGGRSPRFRVEIVDRHKTSIMADELT